MDDALREWIDEKLADCYKKKESWHAYSIHVRTIRDTVLLLTSGVHFAFDF